MYAAFARFFDCFVRGSCINRRRKKDCQMGISQSQLEQLKCSFKAKVVEAYSLPRSNLCYDELAHVLQVKYNGEMILEESDLMDNATFDKDLAWIAPFLERIYLLGVLDGEETAITNFRKYIDHFAEIINDPPNSNIPT